MTPTLLRRRMSRRSRITEKLVRPTPVSRSSLAVMFSTPMLNRPARPVERPPTSIGTPIP